MAAAGQRHRYPGRYPGQAARRLWPLLAPGGVLLYATCSVLREENDRQVGRFLERRNDAVELPLAGAWGTALAYGRQILPGEQGMDGFYYAKLGKRDG